MSKHAGNDGLPQDRPTLLIPLEEGPPPIRSIVDDGGACHAQMMIPDLLLGPDLSWMADRMDRFLRRQPRRSVLESTALSTGTVVRFLPGVGTD